MRSATIVIRWEGPDKKVREFIEDRIDGLFYDLSMENIVTFADSDVTFRSKA